DLTDPSQAVLLSRNPLPVATGGSHVQNANAVAQVIFGVNPVTGTNYIFVLDGNNGVAAFVLSGGTIPPPIFAKQPANLRVIETATNSIDAQSDQIVAFRWFKDTNSPSLLRTTSGVSADALTFNNASNANSGDYFCIISNANGMAT